MLLLKEIENTLLRTLLANIKEVYQSRSQKPNNSRIFIAAMESNKSWSQSFAFINKSLCKAFLVGILAVFDPQRFFPDTTYVKEEKHINMILGFIKSF